MSSFAPNSTGFLFFSYNGTNERRAHADDPVRYAVGTVIVHILLLLIDGANRIQTFHILYISDNLSGHASGKAVFSISRIMKSIRNLLDVLSSPGEQRNILGLTNIGRCVGGVHDYSAAVSASFWMVAKIIIVILGLGLFCLALLCVPHNHPMDFHQHFRCQPLTEVYHQGWIKGRLFGIIAGIPAEALRVRVLLNLKCSFFIGIVILRLR